jgi:hypothetical protein
VLKAVVVVVVHLLGGLDFRSGNPSISRRVGRSLGLDSKDALLSGPLSGHVDIVGGITAFTVMIVPL